MTGRAEHWEGVYASKAPEDVSWFQPRPEDSARLVLAGGVPESVLDVGAGASSLADLLVPAGVGHVTLLDLSPSALATTRERLGDVGDRVDTVVGDVLTWRRERTYEVWHDRAVFHFLTDAGDRAAYLETLRAALAPGGRVVLMTFAADGPEQCSGLPVRRYDDAALAAELGAGFEPVASERIEHVTPWETVQPFTALVARRVG